MKKVLLLLFISNLAISQTARDSYENHLGKGIAYLEMSDFNLAKKELIKALVFTKSNSGTPYFMLSQCYFEMDSLRLAEHWLRLGVSEGGSNLKYMEKFKGFDEFRNSAAYLNTSKDYNKLRAMYFGAMENIDLYLEITELIERDQFARKIDDFIAGRTQEYYEKVHEEYEKAKAQKDQSGMSFWLKKTFPDENPEYQDLKNNLVKAVDKLNVERLKEITKEHGWQQRGFLILWHQRLSYKSSNDVWDFFTPYINKAIAEGKESSKFWNIFDSFKRNLNSN